MELEPGSYRERSSQVFYRDGKVYRGLTDVASLEWAILKKSRFFEKSQDQGMLVGTRELDSAEAQTVLHELKATKAGPFAAVLAHDRIPLITYPYEWSFGMLKDAALLQLRLMREALQEGLISQDASAYNFQWRGTQACAIDISSWVRLEPSHPWAGWVAYRQFCEQFLFPLMLQAHRGIGFQSFLRGRLEGISLETMRGLFSKSDCLKTGVWSNVILQSYLDRKLAKRGGQGSLAKLESGLKASLIQANIDKLMAQVERLSPSFSRSEWSGYDSFCPYSAEDSQIKESFVKKVLSRQARKHVWDLGCNEGRFSRMAAAHAEQVLAFDSDPAVIEKLYQSLSREKQTRILPLVMDLVDSSPACGWRGRERKRLESRGMPDFILCLGLIHHWSLSRHVPLSEIISYLSELGGELVIEFPTRKDAWVAHLLESRAMAYEEYDEGVFEQLLKEKFQIEERISLCQGTRVLYFATPKA